MKYIKGIAFLTVIASAIITFWLAPNINKAGAVQYTRRYEETGFKPLNANDTTKHDKTTPPPDGPGRPEEKVRKPRIYRTETIRPKNKKQKLNAQMFSRSVQYVEELETYDSTNFMEVDTTMAAPDL